MKEILGINEIEQYFQVSYELFLKWKDPRLIYHNLKRNSNLNVLSKDESSSIWNPSMVLSNTKATETIVRNEKSLTKVIANSNYTYELADFTYLRNIFIFEGKQNDLELSHVLETNFICRYDMALYPFD